MLVPKLSRMTTRKFDVVLFGATGFTGRLTAEYLARARTPRPLRWALAGRNREKLEAVRRDISLLAPGGAQAEIVIADSQDERALAAMAASTRVVATTVGPYIRYGEPLVRACVEQGADYVDLTGEPEFVDNMIERYANLAEERRVKIVNACGFDSIPHDLGAYFTLKALEARLAANERGKVPVTIEGFVRASGSFSGGTWHSAVTAMGRFREYNATRKQRSARLPMVGENRRVSATPSRVRYRSEIGAWGVPMPTIDPQVVRRSARLLPEYGPDFRYGHFLAQKRLTSVVGLAVGVGTVFALAQFSPTRALLLKVRDSGEGPSEEQRKKSFFKVTFLARALGHEVKCEVRGGDPGYGETAKMLAESALCLAFDGERAPRIYGVVPPAAAFGTPLIERLTKAGIVFEDVGAVREKAPEASGVSSFVH
jgi:short subunit dehydrogenase-like uncharacterized protein